MTTVSFFFNSFCCFISTSLLFYYFACQPATRHKKKRPPRNSSCASRSLSSLPLPYGGNPAKKGSGKSAGKRGRPLKSLSTSFSSESGRRRISLYSACEDTS